MLACLTLIQVLADIFLDIIEWGLNINNYTIKLAESINTIGQHNIIIILCLGILTPIFEELTYRGILLKQLQKYGDWYAIIITAILFGLRHLTISQVLVGTMTGVLFGYITIQYGLKWSIFLHIFNNFIIAEVLVKILDIIGGNIGEYIWITVNLMFAVYAVIMLIKDRKRICTSLVQTNSLKTTLLQTLRVPSFLIVIVYSIMMNIITLLMFLQKM